MQLESRKMNGISLEDYNSDIDEALAQVKTGNYVTQDELEKEMEAW